MNNARHRNWAEFWSLRRSVILKNILRLLVAFPLAVILSTQLALWFSCLSGEELRCIWVSSIFKRLTIGFYLLVAFGIFVLSCQIVFYSWQQYVKGKFDNDPSFQDKE